MARIVAGPFAGNECQVVSVQGDKLKVKVTLFGRVMETDLPRAYVELDGEDPRPELRKQLAEDQARLTGREEAAFWRRLAAEPEGDALEELAAYEVHCARVREVASARTEALLAAFDVEAAALPDDQVRAWFNANEARWLSDQSTVNLLKQSWRADSQAFDAYVRTSDQARARELRAARAREDRDFLAWRDTRWSEAERARLLEVAERELSERRQRVAERFRSEWGLEVPDGLFRFWLFFRSLQPSEREALAAQELSPFGVMDLFDRPEARPRDGLDMRVHGRYYRDPPEMLTFMHGGSDGLHFGLFFADGLRSSGVVRYYNNDGVSLNLPEGTPLSAVRARLERAAKELEEANGEPEDALRERRFLVRLAREAVARFDEGDHIDAGAADAAACVPDDERCGRIAAEDPGLPAWVAEARRRLQAGDASEALRLGHDLHWCSAGDKAREELATELLAGAYRTLGRHSLAGIVEAHHRHRSLSSVDVLEPGRAIG